MAARAHVQDHPFVSSRPRRDVYFRREDPVVLPRSRGYTLDFRLIGAALAATALVTLGTYAVFTSSAPALGPTQETSISREWVPDTQVGHAAALKALAGPALSTRSLAAPEGEPSEVTRESASALQAFPQSTVSESSAPLRSAEPSAAPRSNPAESLRGQDLVPELPATPELYPNPTSTPPDGVAPPEVTTDLPTPSLDTENPYR